MEGGQPKREPATIRTIAETAGVHPSTVSRALRRPDTDDPTAKRIQAIAAELGYRPDVAAASLRTRRSHALGVLVHRLTDVVQAMIYEGIERTALERGYQTIVANTYDVLAEQQRRAQLMVSRRVDGLIVADAHLDGVYADWVAELGVPYMLVNRRCGEHPAVTTDDYLGGRLAGAHLADLGHTRIAILAGSPHSSATSERTAGCRDVLRDRGIEVADELVEPCTLEARSGSDAMAALLERDPELTAAFAINDFTALGALSALRSRGRQPGSDIAVVGFNDITIAEPTQLSTIKSRQGQMGAMATRLLFDVMAGRPVESLRLAPELVVRATSCPPPNGPS